MIELLKKHLLKIVGLSVGALGGFLYYYFVGCGTGACPITSNPYVTIIYGAVLGYLLFDVFSPKSLKKQTNNIEEND